MRETGPDPFWDTTLPLARRTVAATPEDLNNFAPNFGFAWTPRIWQSVLGQDKTVIRGGYRIAYDPAFYNIFLNAATAAPVVNAGTILNVGLPGTLTGAGVQSAYLNQIPTGLNPGSRNQTRVSSDFHNPYVQQWSFGIERQISSRTSFETRYVGNHGVGNFQTINGNPLLCSSFSGSTFTGSNCTAGLMVSAPNTIPSGAAPCTTAGATSAAGAGASSSEINARVGRLDCNFTNLRVRNNGAWSIYHGLQNEVKLRDFHGLTADVAYTWSKALDNTSEVFASTGGISTPAAQNPFDPNFGERGVSAQSFPHVVTTYWVYDLPWMKNQQGILGHILGGWQWSGTHRYQSGAPITAIQNTNNGDPYCDAVWNNAFIGTGNDSCRPILSNPSAPFNTAGRYTSATQVINVTTGQTIDPRSVHFIINNASAVNALCGGNPFACAVSRNVNRAMARNQVDLSVAKNIKLTERVGLQLRADVLNALNYMYLGVPGLNANNRNINGNPPNTFGETWNNTGNGFNRFMWLSAHITF